MTNCINCNQEVSTPFCPACGQKNPVKKINMLNMWSDFSARIYGFDGMFPRTLRDLTLRPGQVARDYIQGNRIKYYGPIGYFFLVLTIYMLLGSMLGVDFLDFMMKSNPTNVSEQGEGVQEVTKGLTLWMIENFRSVSFCITLFTVFFTWLLFRKSKYNFVETGALIFFVTGHTMWLSVLMMIVYKITGVAFGSSYLLLISITFTIYAFVNFYQHINSWRIVLRGVFVHILSYVTLTLFIFGIFIYRVSTDKELYNKLKPSNNKPKVEAGPSSQ